VKEVVYEDKPNQLWKLSPVWFQKSQKILIAW